MEFGSLEGDFIKNLCRAHYESIYNPPRKAFDVYTAVALGRFMGEKAGNVDSQAAQKALLDLASPKLLFYSGEYGMSLVSVCDTSEAVLKSYIDHIDVQVRDATAACQA
jgi:hypothetical protein